MSVISCVHHPATHFQADDKVELPLLVLVELEHPSERNLDIVCGSVALEVESEKKGMHNNKKSMNASGPLQGGADENKCCVLFFVWILVPPTE